jgi:outer membrane protein TolC
VARALTGVVACLCVACAASLVYVAEVARAESPNEVVDLPMAVTLAEKHSWQLKASDHAIAAALAQLDEARISPFFQFRGRLGLALVPDAEGVPGYTPDPTNQIARDFGPALGAGIEGAIPLWTFGKLTGARNAARAGVRAAETQRVRARGELRYQVRRAFYGLSFALDTQQMLDEGLPRVEQALARLEERLEQGDADANESDRYRIATVIAEIRARRAEAEHLARSATTALEVLTGRTEISIPECPLVALPFIPESLKRYRSSAQKHRPELVLLSAAIDARQAELEVAHARYFPDIALALGAETQYVPGRTPDAYYTPWFVAAALVARWDLDFPGHALREERALQKSLELRDQRRAAVEGTRVEVSDRHAAVVDAIARADAWDEGHRDARRWFISAAQNHQLGVLPIEDLVDAVTAYFRARFSRLQALFDLNTSVAALELVVGTPVLPDAAWSLACGEDADNVDDTQASADVP